MKFLLIHAQASTKDSPFILRSHTYFWHVKSVANFDRVLSAKGQIISKCFLVSSDSSKKRTKTSHHSSEMNSFVCFWKTP